MFGQKGIVAPGKNIDNGVADGNNVKRGGGNGHAYSFIVQERGKSRCLYSSGASGATPLIDGSRPLGEESAMVLTAALRAFPSIFHGAALRLALKTLLLSLMAFALLALALWFAVHAARVHFGWGAAAWGGWAEAAATVIGIAAAAWLLFRAVAIAIMNLFADDIIVAVERDSYPEAAARARPVGWAHSLHFALRSLARTIGWNLLALPAYALLLATGIGTIGLFLMLNAILLGRDLADMVEPRHPGLPPIPRGSRWLMGLVSALLFLVPLLNLLAPIWSAAMAVHMLHGARRKMP
jgi:uncharacterized protein involved in cysteine biosynthesis